MFDEDDEDDYYDSKTNVSDLPVFKKGEEIQHVVRLLVELIPEDNDHLQSIKGEMLYNAGLLTVKIAGTEAVELIYSQFGKMFLPETKMHRSNISLTKSQAIFKPCSTICNGNLCDYASLCRQNNKNNLTPISTPPNNTTIHNLAIHSSERCAA